ncbi:MAG: GrpB family protein [Anaerolineales bacterium]
MKKSEKAKETRGSISQNEEYLRSVTIGERKPRNSSIYIAPYDPRWPARFSELAGRIRKALGGKVLRLEHVGSTSIPGLAAKPIIDMVLVVADSTDEPSYVPHLENEGFSLRIREPEWYEHRLFKVADIRGNLHVFSDGCEEVDRMLTFRNWLRSHENDRKLYEGTKRALAARTWKYTQDYADAKTDVVQEILARARTEDRSPE